MLRFTANNEPFATGKTAYNYQPAPNDITARILLQVQVEGVLLPAILDTAAPYVVCAPYLANEMSLDPENALENISMLIRGEKMDGGLYRAELHFLADEGEGLAVDATIFVPSPRWQETWGDHPSYIGLTGCLERIRFAIDPGVDTFYFGPA